MARARQSIKRTYKRRAVRSRSGARRRRRTR